MTDKTGHLSVLHVVPLVGAGGEFGGPVSVAEEDVRELAARGHDVAVTGLRLGDEAAPEGFRPSQWITFPAHRIVPRTGMLGMTNVRFLAFLFSAARRVDLLHLHAGRDLVSLAALVVAWVRGVPFVAQTHGMVRPRDHVPARIFDAVFFRLLRRASTVLWLTDDEEEELRGFLGPKASLRYLRNGLRRPPYEPRTRSGATAPTVMFLARLHPVKGVTAFVEVAAVLRDRGVPAQFVVHGPDQGDLQAMHRAVDRLGLEDVVRYAGPLTHEQAVEALAGADVYMLPSSKDWMPMSLLEALAMGVPCVCNDSCGLAPELAEAGAAIVTDGSVEALAEAVQSILQEPGRAEALSGAAIRVVQDRFSIQRVARDLETIYREALGTTALAISSTTRSSPADADK